ncbi:SH3 domain-containing protein [Alkalihalobacterium bogoriense]|uniref:SH3 domain-containing protein n=1 Tax=Alkalihalobacterium bogoriense TaxID=246272 RepID=UPI00047D3350|nr:SH3 domain-containing protein [Alkalihalobacterium bogoriense]
MNVDIEGITRLNNSIQNISQQYNKMLKPIIEHQEMISRVANSGIQGILGSINSISDISIPKFNLPLFEIQNQYVDMISKIQMDLPRPIIDFSHYSNLYTQFSSLAQVGNEFANMAKTMNIGIANIADEFHHIDWSSILSQIPYRDLVDVRQEDHEEIQATVTEVLEEYDLVNPNKGLEEKIEQLTNEINSLKKSLTTKDAIKLSIIANIIFSLFMFLIGPFLQPIKEEYSSFVHQNGKAVIKEIKAKVHSVIETNVALNNYKIVSSERLTVRITNKTNSNAVGQLYFGQVVQVVERKRKWTKVSYVNSEGEIIEGWVYSRYLHNLIK